MVMVLRCSYGVAEGRRFGGIDSLLFGSAEKKRTLEEWGRGRESVSMKRWRISV